MKVEHCTRIKIVFVSLPRFGNFRNVEMFKRKQRRGVSQVTRIVES